MPPYKAVIIVGKGDIHWPALRAVSSRYDIIALDGAYDQLPGKSIYRISCYR